MPSRRKNCNSVIAMEMKKTIDNRLLEISILVEDYIYEDKPIRRHEAEMYAKEVASYADKCLGDERSLQVIEKLRRHMRSIIAEQGEPIDEEIFAQPLPDTTPEYDVPDDNMTPSGQDREVEDLTQEFNSPDCVEKPIEKGRKKRKAIVKRNIRDNSELDDDLAQCTQDIETEDHTQDIDSPNCVEESIKKGKKKRKAIVKRNIRDNSELDDDLTQCTQDIEIEDHTQDINSPNCVEEPIKKGKKKRKAIVKRNIRDSGVDNDLTQCTRDTDIDINIQETNSQNSVKKPNTRARNKRNVIVKPKTKVKRNVSEKYYSDTDVIDLCDDDDKLTECNDCINVEESPQHSISSLYILSNEVLNTPVDLSVCSPSILTSFDAVPGILKLNRQEVSEKPNLGGNVTEDTTKNVNKFTKRLIDESIDLKTDRNIPDDGNMPLSTKDNAVEKINNMKRRQINKQMYTQVNNTNKLKNTINTQKTSVNLMEISKNKVDGASNTYSNDNKLKKASIYSDKVINDLSWIENIRYVREIAKEEYEHVSVPEIFWDNYTLPEKWNDNDFLYIKP